MSMEITKMLVLSTNHVTQETDEMFSEALRDGVSFPVGLYAKGHYGWFLNVSEDPHNVEEHPWMTPDLYKVLRFARDQDCDWVMLDRDGDIIDELPSYAW